MIPSPYLSLGFLRRDEVSVHGMWLAQDLGGLIPRSSYVSCCTAAYLQGFSVGVRHIHGAPQCSITSASIWSELQSHAQQGESQLSPG